MIGGCFFLHTLVVVPPSRSISRHFRDYADFVTGCIKLCCNFAVVHICHVKRQKKKKKHFQQPYKVKDNPSSTKVEITFRKLTHGKTKQCQCETFTSVLFALATAYHRVQLCSHLCSQPLCKRTRPLREILTSTAPISCVFITGGGSSRKGVFSPRSLYQPQPYS